MIIMMIFNISISYFHKISFPNFEDYLMMKQTSGKGILKSATPTFFYWSNLAKM